MTQQYHEHLLEAGEKPSDSDSSDSWPWRWILRALTFLVALALALGVLNNGKAAPGPLKYLYISFHGDGSATTPLPQYGVNQILRFDLLNLGDPAQPVLGKGSPTPPRMLRDMQVLKDGTLFVAQGLKFDSCILQYGPCDQDGVRQFQREYRSPILVHPYALTLPGDTLFASTQDSGTVVGFNLTESHDLLSSGDRINFNLHGAFRYRPGITYRGIANYQKCLYLSVTEMDVVAVICHLDRVSRRIPVRHPIGLMVDEEKKELYIASPAKDKDGQQGEVLVVDLSNDKVLRRLRHEGMEHPTNMVLHKDKVIVASQTQKSILEFDRSSGEFSRVLIENLPDAPENIALSPC